MADPIYTYYVDSVNGADANPGTQALPWKTIAKVNSTVTAGQSVGFRRGTTIAGQLIPAANGITYGAYDSGASPIINGAGQTQCIGASARSSLTIQDLRLTAGGTYGLAADGVNGLTISGLEVDNANSSGILLGNGTQTVNIANCQVHHNGIGASGDRDGIGIGGGGAAPHDIVITDCDIYNNWHDGVRVSMTSAWNIPSNVTVKGNKTRNQTTGSGVAADACTNLTVIFNAVTNNAGVGIYIVPASISGHVENVTGVVYHNTIVGNLWGMLTTHGGGGTFNINARNNLFQNNGVSGSSAEMSLSTLTTWVSDYNLVFHAAGGNFMHGAGSFMSWATWKATVTPHDANSKNLDPLLNPDYTLQVGSPAVGAGVFIPGLGTANPPNIGASQVVPTNEPAAPVRVTLFGSLTLAASTPVQLSGATGSLFILNTGPGNLYISSGPTPGINAASMVIPPLKSATISAKSLLWVAADQAGGASVMAT